MCLNAIFFCLLGHTAFWNQCFYFSGPILKIFVEGPTLHFRSQIWKWQFFKKFIEMFIKKKIPFKHTKFNSQFVCNSFIQNAFCNKIIWNLKCILLFNSTLLFAVCCMLPSSLDFCVTHLSTQCFNALHFMRSCPFEIIDFCLKLNSNTN